MYVYLTMLRVYTLYTLMIINLVQEFRNYHMSVFINGDFSQLNMTHFDYSFFL